MAIVELREYKIKPNMKQAWLAWIIPFHVNK